MTRPLLSLLLLLLLPALCRGAVGTPLDVVIEDNGWVARVKIDGFVTNAIFNNFFIATTNRTATATNVFYTLSATNGLKIDLVSPGHQPEGSSNAIAMSVYGLEVLRLPFPDQNTNDIFFDATGTNAVFRVVLSDFVGYKDVSLLATINVGAFATTNAATNCAGITGLSVTNGSVLPYSLAIANWVDHGWKQETGSVMTVRAVGFNHYARNGQPLACMEFITTDEGGVKTTNRVSQMEVDWSTLDAIHFGEYIGRIPLSSFTHSNNLRVDFVAKPWRGDSGAVFDTRDNRYSMPTPFPAAITNFYFTNTYSARAVVALTGSDSLGRSTNVASHDLVSPDHYYLSVNAAMAGIRTNNLTLFGHQTCGGALVDVRTGISNSMGGTASMAGMPRVLATIREYPGDTVVFTNHTGTQDISDRVKLKDVEIGYIGSVLAWANSEAIVLENCRFNSTGTAPFSTGCKAIYVMGGSTPVFAQGFKPSSANLTAFALLRGIDLDGMNSVIHWWTMVGCRKTTHSGEAFTLTVNNSSWPSTAPDFQILYNNSLKYLSNTAVLVMGTSHGLTNGMAVVQNELESVRTSSAITTYDSALLSSNVVWLHNTTEGFRQQYFYNESGSSPVWRIYCQAKNSIFTNPGEASDTDPTGNGGRTGDWPVRWRVGSSGNIIQMLNYEASHSQIENQGINNFRPPPNLTTDAAWMQYINRAGAGSGGTGPGEYQLQSSSPAFRLPRDWILSQDIKSRSTGSRRPPGAHGSGQVLDGWFF